MQAVNVTSVPLEECKRIIGEDADQSHLCAVPSVGHGVCSRDSGGPIVHENELVGVVNWAEGCGLGLPEGYGKISYFYDWIEDKIRTE